MTKFLPIGNNELSQFLKEHESDLRREFFEELYLETFGSNPAYVRNNGESLYENVIKCVSLKLTGALLDHNEKKILKWDPECKYRYRVRENNPALSEKLVTWNKLLDSFDIVEQVLFNIAYPNASISYHVGVSVHCYRMHWCLQNNTGFIFDLGGEQKKWTEGVDNMFRFDDGKINHGVLYEESGNSQPRIVCIMDVKREYWNEE